MLIKPFIFFFHFLETNLALLKKTESLEKMEIDDGAIRDMENV